MSKLTLLLALLWSVLLVSPGFSAIVHVSHTQASAAGSCGASTGTQNMASCATGATTTTFTFTPTNSGSGVSLFFFVGSASATSPTFTLTGLTGATTWTITRIGTTSGTATNFVVAFWAFVPTTGTATFTLTSTVANGGFFNDLVDEWTGTNVTNPVNIAGSPANGSGTPSVSVTPTVANTAIWAAVNDSVTAVGTTGACAASACTAGANDGGGDWSEFKVLSGGSGVSQVMPFTGSSTWEGLAIAIAPAAAGGTVRHRAWVIN